MEDDEERNTEEEPKPEPAVKKSSTKVKTRPISNKRRATRSRVSEISLLENITEDTGEEVGASKEPESTLHMPELPLSSPKTFSQEDQSQNLSEFNEERIEGTSVGLSSSRAAEKFCINPAIHAIKTQLESTPQRVTRSNSRSSAVSSPSQLSEKSTRTRLTPRKPPLTLLRDPFSPQITEELEQKVLQKRQADKARPRKKYSAIKKVKSKKI